MLLPTRYFASLVLLNSILSGNGTQLCTGQARAVQTTILVHSPLFCSSMDDIPECDLISFGSATGGKSLTKDTNLPNYVHYGYCATTGGSCNAHYSIYESVGSFPVAGNLMYSECPACQGNKILFCLDWPTMSIRIVSAVVYVVYRMISIIVVAHLLGSFMTLVQSETLSLQGNPVFDPLESYNLTLRTLKGCAALCMMRTPCKLFIYNTDSGRCDIANVISDTLTRYLVQNELAYLKGDECAKTRRIQLNTAKPGRFFHAVSGRRITKTFALGPRSFIVEEPPFCHAINFIPGCDFISYGSADEGCSLTTNTAVPGFKHYGWCTRTKGVCSATMPILEYPGANNCDFIYSGGAYNQDKTGKFVCYFWNSNGNRCTKERNSQPYSSVFLEHL